MRRRHVVVLEAIAAVLTFFGVSPTAVAAKRCGRVTVPARALEAKVRVVQGPLTCHNARRQIAAAFTAEVVRHNDGFNPTNGVFWRVDGWRCFIGLGDSQTFCVRAAREVDGSFRADDGWTF